MKYEFLEHTADVKFRTFGKNLDETFENAILAFAEFVAKDKKIECKKEKTIKLKGHDKKSLLYNFLDELVYLMDAEDFVACCGEVKIKGNSLVAYLEGDSVSNYSGLDHFKAATYAEMRISKKSENRWMIQAVMDV